MSVQVIEKDGKPERAVIPYEEYQRLLEEEVFAFLDTGLCKLGQKGECERVANMLYWMYGKPLVSC
jgi:hypothetical protein